MNDIVDKNRASNCTCKWVSKDWGRGNNKVKKPFFALNPPTSKPHTFRLCLVPKGCKFLKIQSS